MNTVTNLAINWTEQGLVPDTVIRAGIRRLCKQRLAEIQAGDAEAASAAFEEFVALMNAAELAHCGYSIWDILCFVCRTVFSLHLGN